MRKNKFFTPKQMVMLALLASIAYLIVSLVRIPVVLFLKYEPKDVIITIGGFLFGPMASFVVSLLVSLIEMVTISETGPIGALMNLLSTCCFACTASYIYKKNRTLKGAILALVAGSVFMTAAMILWNWLVTPLYMGVDRATVQGMLLSVFLPFNLLKAGLNTAFVLFLILSIFFSTVEPFFIFFSRKKDKGMPPRCDVPQAPLNYVETAYQPAPPAIEPWEAPTEE